MILVVSFCLDLWIKYAASAANIGFNKNVLSSSQDVSAATEAQILPLQVVMEVLNIDVFIIQGHVDMQVCVCKTGSSFVENW